MIALAVNEMRGRCDDHRRRRLQRHAPRRGADRTRDRARRRRAAVGQPVLQPADTGAGSSATTRRSRRRPTCRSCFTTSRSEPPATCPTSCSRARAARQHLRASSRRTRPTWRKIDGLAALRRQRRHARRRARSRRAGGILTGSHLFGDEMHRMVDEPARRREIDAGPAGRLPRPRDRARRVLAEGGAEHDRHRGRRATASVCRARRSRAVGRAGPARAPRSTSGCRRSA